MSRGRGDDQAEGRVFRGSASIQESWGSFQGVNNSPGPVLAVENTALGLLGAPQGHAAELVRRRSAAPASHRAVAKRG